MRPHENMHLHTITQQHKQTTVVTFQPFNIVFYLTQRKVFFCSFFGSIFFRLEAELLEKPLVLARLVALFERGLDRRLALALLGRVLDRLLIDNTFVDSNVNRVSGRHKVVVVDDLKAM